MNTTPKIGKYIVWSTCCTVDYTCLFINSSDLIPPGVCNLLNPSTIYANNEVNLDEVDIYGFDYDYTLAMYSNSLNEMIYNKARQFLIEHYKYPQGINKYSYIPNFAARGLHYDIQKGLLMKIDAFHYIQMGTVYRGLNPVPDEEVMQLYGGSNHVPLHQVSGFYGKGPKMKQFMDVFSIPEMTLLACANDYFISNDIEYDPVHLYKDVSDAIAMVHIKGYMYKWIMADLEKYILRGDETYAVLHRLASHGKKLFLITNSPFSFVDKGMKYMVGKDWRDFFDVVIVQAEKPHFFNDCVKPFRRLDSNGDLQWDKIKSLDKGQIYKQGNLVDFLKLTGWRGSKVLYFGDHLYSDLAVSHPHFSISLCSVSKCARSPSSSDAHSYCIQVFLPAWRVKPQAAYSENSPKGTKLAKNLPDGRFRVVPPHSA
uniref:5'-nucleotidase domain containing 2 n=1 Tax=Astyanax mexicanus TaxID=7994 RepID=A0A8B9LNT7_ASTMX